MRQEIIVAKPPVYDRCIAAFGAEAIVGMPVLWSWGDRIYNPLNIEIPRELIAHERVHGHRQFGQVETWWDRYLASPAFRYEEELVAHRAEWHSMVRYGAGKNLAPVFDAIASRLASALYGNVVTLEQAKAALICR